MRVILDGMGGDNAPAEIVKGAVWAAKEIDDKIIIVGDEAKIKAELGKYKYDKAQIEVCHASEVITGEDSPVKAIRRKTDSSMVKGINMVKNGEGDLFVSAGNTGALMSGGVLILGKIEGLDRPALASVYPILGDAPSLLVDAGANADCKPKNLLEFATMGSIYMEKVLNRRSPKVGLVNLGTEETKGNALTKETFGMLKESDLNFIGNVEAREVPKGVCDVIVCDGFTGNVILKLTEGMAWRILKLIKKKFTEGLPAKLGAALLINKIKELRADFDYSEYGGAPVLGVKKPIVKMHGSSEANSVKNTIIKGIPYAAENVIGIIENELAALKAIEEEAEAEKAWE